MSNRRNVGDGSMLAAIKACAATKAAVVTTDEPFDLAFKAVEGEEGVLVFKVSKAGNFDREKERAPLAALKAAVYRLAQDIGKPGEVEVDINHAEKSTPCDILMCWIGDPMPDPHAAYVALRPHDKAIVEAAKAGYIVGASWSGPYRLKDAVL